MGGSSSILKPQELNEFRKLNTSIDNVEIPARSESRSLTDKKGLVMFGICLLIFIPLYAYSMALTDIRRLNHGYDSCGNMCGYNNPKDKDVACSGKDYAWKRYFKSNGDVDSLEELLGGNYSNSRCVIYCDSGEISNFMGKCGLPKERNSKVRERRDLDSRFESDLNSLLESDLNSRSEPDFNFNRALKFCEDHWWKFVVTLIITILLCATVLLLLRFFPEIVVWGVLITGMGVCIVLTCYLWFCYFQEKLAQGPFLVAAIFMTIITLIVVVVFICLFKKIRLVVQLYKEATKAVFAMPHILLVPVLMTFIQLIVIVGFIVSNVYLITSRHFSKISDDYYQYEMNGAMEFTIIFHWIMTILSMHFISGFQYMVVSGSIAAWYFAKNKQYLDSPILTSFRNTFKYHLGTIAFGAFILTIMDIIRAIIRSIFRNEKVQWLLECCCANIEAFLKFLSKNAYIETAIHGQSFLRSGRRAAKLLLSNFGSVIAINSVGNFVLGVVVFTLIIASTAISVVIFKDGSSNDYLLPTVICFIMNIIIVVLTFAIFDTTIDTLFICFCEDKVINDGLSKPYLMSRGLMEFVENSKQIYGSKD